MECADTLVSALEGGSVGQYFGEELLETGTDRDL